MNIDFEVGTHYGQLAGLEPGKDGIRAAQKQIIKEWQLGFAQAKNDEKQAAKKDDGCGHDALATRTTAAKVA